MSVLTYNVWFDLDDWQPRFDAVAGIIEHLQPTVHVTHTPPLAIVSLTSDRIACAVVRVRVRVRAIAIAGGVPSGGDPAVRTGSEAASVAQPKLPHARR